MNESNSPIRPELYGAPTPADSVGRISQIIAGALIAGVVAFACVAFFIAKGEPAKTPMIALMGAGMAVMMIVMRFVVPMVIVNNGKAQLKQTANNEQRSLLAGLYQTKMIIGMALLEGAAFFNLVAYIIEKQFWSYGVVAFLLGIMAISFPSQGQFESWAEDMKRDWN
jgi:hypothetical protein